MKNKTMLVIVAGLMILLAVAVSVFSVRYVEKGGSLITIGTELRNTIEIPLSRADCLLADYGSKNLEVYTWKEDRIVIKEYLGNAREDAKATVEYDGDEAIVTGGRWNWSWRNLFWGGLNERIEIYLPEQGISGLELVTGSGNINAKGEFSVETAKAVVRAGSGNIRWRETKAKDIVLYANSGNIHGEALEGVTDVHTGSGNITIKNITGILKAEAGSGNITVEELAGGCMAQAGSGNLRVEAKAVTDDITLHTGSGNQRLDLPKSLSFSMEVNTNSGNIHTDYDDLLSYGKKGNQATGQVGEAPVCLVTCQAGSGNVTIRSNVK